MHRFHKDLTLILQCLQIYQGEKLLNSLGGMFSMPWKAKKTREIKGPVITSDKSSNKSENNKEQREKLGVAPIPKGKAQPGSKTPPPEPTNAIQKVEVSIFLFLGKVLLLLLRLIGFISNFSLRRQSKMMHFQI